MISWDEFNKEFLRLCDGVERRRRRYLSYFYSAVVFVVIVNFLIFFYSGSSESTKALGHGGYLIWVVLGSITWVLLPVYAYRGVNSTAGIKPTIARRFSLKDNIYSVLFRLFGPIEFAPQGGVSLAAVRESILLPAHRLYMTEDYITGPLNTVQAYLCEARLAEVVKRKRIALFQGLLLVCDISDSRLKLRQGFRGRTAIVNKAKKDLLAKAALGTGMKKFSLPEEYEAVFEAYTTDADEAQAIITPALLEQLTDVGSFLQGLTRQIEHWDNKLAHAASAFYDFCGNIFLGAQPELPSEQPYKAATETSLDITKADPLSTSASSLNRTIEIEFYKDKFIVTIPYPHDLFEPNSLFEPALNDEDARVTYKLMEMLQNVTQHLNKVVQ